MKALGTFLAHPGVIHDITPVCSKWLAHPGESAAAEKFAVKMQRKILRQLPAGMRRNVTVVATVHTDATVFLYAQPTLEPVPGAADY